MNCPFKKYLLNLKFSSPLLILFNKLRSRSFSELTRQINPPTTNGHAPLFMESRKSYQSVNPSHVWTWWVSPCWVKLSRRFHSWWCFSVNSFKFQSCDHTPPGVWYLWFLTQCKQNHHIISIYPESTSFMVATTTVSDHLRSYNFRSWLMKTSL